ncbi:MAG TPA: GTPase [Dermatophilaceae bacterium]|nr:GTPase [Dermatophilaceae bacterium]
MSPLRMGRAPVVDTSVERLPGAVAALAAALDLGAAQLPPDAVRRARTVLGKVDSRLALTGNHTVVALAGATGSGKSSLFNLLVGAEVAEVGARRPTTSRPTAAVWGEQSAVALLDWLEVRRRHAVVAHAGDEQGSTGALNLDGLVLLDLPDFDSRVEEHRAEVDRMLALVDVYVWVTDPEKYADALLHDDYVSRLADRQASTIVVLNQADRLTPEALVVCAADLQRLLAADGVADAEVVITAATSGAGVMELNFALAKAVQTRTAARRRLLADVRAVAAELRGGVADTDVQVAADADARLVDALGNAAGVPAVLDAVQRHYLREAVGRTGWPFTRWARRLRPDPLRRLRLDQARSAERGDITTADIRSVLGRSSLPHATPAARAGVQLATQTLADRAGAQLPVRWASAVAEASSPPGPDLGDALDQAVLGTSLRSRTPGWWRVWSVLQWLLALAAVAGLGWLAVLAALGFLQLPVADPPRLGPLPYPLVLAVGGLLLGFLLGALARPLAARGARRRGAQIDRRLRESITAVAHQQVVAPVRLVLERHRRTREQLDIALR